MKTVLYTLYIRLVKDDNIINEYIFDEKKNYKTRDNFRVYIIIYHYTI